MKIRFRLLVALAMIGLAGVIAGSGRPAANAPGERSLTLYNIHNGERLSVVYRRGDDYDSQGLEKLNWIFRDWRRNEATRMDPKAFDILWEIYQELGSKEPIHVISGFRSSKTNEKLRKGGGGQAKNSQHIEGKALDVHFPDVPVQQLRYSALIREKGGVGYYPTSALPFVHIDTGRVRMWPRMPRHELALLFPGGKSKYLPTDGKPISKRDVEAARTKYAKLAQTIAAFHAFRANAQDRTLVASLEPRAKAPEPAEVGRSRIIPASRPVVASLGGPDLGSLAGLVAPKPVPASRSGSAAASRLPLEEQEKLDALVSEAVAEPEPEAFGEWAVVTEPAAPAAEVTLASLAQPEAESTALVPPRPQQVTAGAFLSKLGWARAPELDDEHDNELSYRPFPIGPFLSADPDIDHPALAHLVHPDLGQAHEAIDDGRAPVELGFRQNVQLAGLFWSDGFSGEDVTKVLYAGSGEGRAASGKRVRTASQ